MFCMWKKKTICHAYVSKNDSNREEKVIILVIPNGEGHQAKSKWLNNSIIFQ